MAAGVALTMSGRSANAQAVSTITSCSFKDGADAGDEPRRQVQVQSKLRRR